MLTKVMLFSTLRNSLKYVLCLFLCLTITYQVVAQDKEQLRIDSLLTYMGRAMSTSKNLVQEKVYLHFDNTGYFMGEKIWFKAYVVRADNNKPAPMSRVLYVELVNPNGDVVKKRKLKVDSLGQAYGDVTLDSIYGSGFYEVRAYTRYMTNWGSAACFSRVFPVFKAPMVRGNYKNKRIEEHYYSRNLLNVREEDTIHTRRLNVVFYPEGGDLVQGILSRVAFQMTDDEGCGVSAQAEVVDDEGNHIVPVSSDSEGRGLFEVLPGSSSLYLVVKQGRYRTRKVRLPEAKGEGVVMRMNLLRDEQVDVLLQSSSGLQGELLGYTLMQGGKVVSCDTLHATPYYQLSFDRDKLPKGVNQITVFNTQGRILCERLFFIAPEAVASDSIKLSIANPVLSPFKKVKFSVQSRPHAHLSLSAMDVASMGNGAPSGNINTWMLLSSEVKGYISHPEYYFEADDKAHRQAADLLMMIQGWRRYDWLQHTWQVPFNHHQPIEDKLYMYGKLNAISRKLPLSNIRLNAYLLKGGRSFQGETYTDSLGHYAFQLPDVDDEWNMQIIAHPAKKKNYYIVGVDRSFSPAKRLLSFYEQQPREKAQSNLKKKMIYKEDSVLSLTDDIHALPTVKVKAKRRYWEGAKESWTSEKAAMKWAELYYDCDDATNEYLDRGELPPTVVDWLHEQNPNFWGTDFIPKNRGDLNYKGKGIVWAINNGYYCDTALRYDSLCVMDSTLDSFPLGIDEVKSIYISEHPSAYKQMVLFLGLKAIEPATFFVYPHLSNTYPMEKGVRRTYFQGYNRPSTFDSPNYGELPPMKDYRRTLYWNPMLTTDDKGHAEVEFYNNSSCKELYISAEGMTPQGELLFYE